MSRYSMTHPFGLTDREAEIMDLMTRHGNVKLAARDLDLSIKTVDNTFARARDRMGIDGRIMAVLTWDRLRRAA